MVSIECNHLQTFAMILYTVLQKLIYLSSCKDRKINLQVFSFQCTVLHLKTRNLDKYSTLEDADQEICNENSLYLTEIEVLSALKTSL